ncbi:hypothetical protein JL721_12352 [Aureococcus anophagefferens]|nr:hypothetical protein JL721_12352 [Aureococcus anophagefferens]
MASFEPPADEALALKEAGNALFAKADLEAALEKWLAALVLLQQREPAPATDEVMAKILTNRALALLKLRPPRADEAVEARLACRLAPTYLKASSRSRPYSAASTRRTDAEFAAIAKFGPADEGRRKPRLMERAMEGAARSATRTSAAATSLAGPAPEDADPTPDVSDGVARAQHPARQVPLRGARPPQKQATCEAVKQAYRAAAQEVHPDHLDHADAAKAFARLRTSYEALQTNGGRTRHLMLLRRNPHARPSVLLKVLDEAGSTKGLAAAAAVFIAAELLRLAIADDEPAPAAPVRTFTPGARRRAHGAAFASNAGELYGGATSAEVQSSVASALEKRRDKRRDDAARPRRSATGRRFVDATVIFYLEPETSAGDPDPELYASCSIDTLCSLPSGDDERVVALSARARRAAAAAPPCENYLQAEVAVETAHGWLTTD